MPLELYAIAPRRVLVLEDQALIGLLMTDLLEELGHSVCAVIAIEQAAVSAAASHQPDLIIADAFLGRGSGLAAMAEILRVRWVPHVYMSGSIVSLGGLPVDAVILRKPFTQHDLIRSLHRAVHTVRLPAAIMPA